MAGTTPSADAGRESSLPPAHRRSRFPRRHGATPVIPPGLWFCLGPPSRPPARSATFVCPKPRPASKSGLTEQFGGGACRSTTGTAAADAGDAAFLGRHARRRIAPATLQCLQQSLLPAAPVLSG